MGPGVTGPQCVRRDSEAWKSHLFVHKLTCPIRPRLFPAPQVGSGTMLPHGEGRPQEVRAATVADGGGLFTPCSTITSLSLLTSTVQWQPLLPHWHVVLPRDCWLPCGCGLWRENGRCCRGRTLITATAGPEGVCTSGQVRLKCFVSVKSDKLRQRWGISRATARSGSADRSSAAPLVSSPSDFLVTETSHRLSESQCPHLQNGNGLHSDTDHNNSP